MRKIPHGAKVGIQLELLAQLNIDAGKASADRGGDRTFQRDMRALNRFSQFLGDVLFVFFESFGAGLNSFPLELQAGSLKNADHGCRDFCADTVAWNESDFMSHEA